MSPVAEIPNAEKSPAIPVQVPSENLPVTVIAPKSKYQWIDFAELWRFRELLFFLTWRDLKVRYKQTFLGVGWALLQPLAAMFVFAVIVGRLSGVSNNIPNYPLFVLCGMIAWTFFANAITTAGNSVVVNERLVTKIYFPRLLVPLSCILAALFDFMISLGILVGMMLIYGVPPSWSIFLAPAILLLLVLLAIGVGSLLSALIVSQRDFRYILNFGVQLWMFATPCIYLASDNFGPTAQNLLPLNPAYGLLLNFRQAILGGPLDWYALGISSAVTMVMLIVGVGYFRRVEKTFADVI